MDWTSFYSCLHANYTVIANFPKSLAQAICRGMETWNINFLTNLYVSLFINVDTCLKNFIRINTFQCLMHKFVQRKYLIGIFSLDMDRRSINLSNQAEKKQFFNHFPLILQTSFSSHSAPLSGVKWWSWESNRKRFPFNFPFQIISECHLKFSGIKIFHSFKFKMWPSTLGL